METSQSISELESEPERQEFSSDFEEVDAETRGQDQDSFLCPSIRLDIEESLDSDDGSMTLGSITVQSVTTTKYESMENSDNGELSLLPSNSSEDNQDITNTLKNLMEEYDLKDEVQSFNTVKNQKLKSVEEFNSLIKSTNDAITAGERQNEMDALKTENESITVELAQVKKKLHFALQELEEQKQKEILTNEEIATLKAEIESMRTGVSFHLSPEDEKQKEIDDLKVNIESMASEISTIKNENQALQPKLLELKSTKEQLSQLNKENEELKATLENKNDIIQEKTNQLEAVSQKPLSGIQALNAVAVNSNIRLLTNQLQAANKTIQDQKQTEADLLKFSQDQLLFSAEQLQEEKNAFAELQKRYDALQNELDGLTTYPAEVETSRTSESRELQQLGRSNDEVELTEENNALKSQIESMKLELGNMSRELEQFKENKIETEEPSEKSFNSKNSIMSLSGAEDDGSDTAPSNLLARVSSGASDNSTYYHQELRDKEEEIEKLQSQIQFVKDELKTKQDVLDEKEKSHQTFVQQLKADKQVEISKLEKLVSEQAAILEAKERLNQTVLEALGELEKEKVEFEKFKEKKIAELQEANLAIKKCQEIVQKYRAKITELETKLTAFKKS